MIIVFTLIVLLFSIMIHEIAHGSVALSLGDQTAKHAGRLTLNPLKHLDPFGSIILPLVLFFTAGFAIGWAKPVPINPFNFRDQRWGELKVAIAGPATNFLTAIIFGIFIRFLSLSPILIDLFTIIVFYNFLLGIFNLLPIPPLDGSHVLFSLLPYRFNNIKLFLHKYGLFVLIFFIFFGLGWVFLLVEGLTKLVIGI